MGKLHLINQLGGQGQRPYLFCKRKYPKQIKVGTWSMLEFLQGDKCKDCYKEYIKTRDYQPSVSPKRKDYFKHKEGCIWGDSKEHMHIVPRDCVLVED